jgi:hypothetical protein
MPVEIETTLNVYKTYYVSMRRSIGLTPSYV